MRTIMGVYGLQKRAQQLHNFGHLTILQYAHENDCPWKSKTCYIAAMKGHCHILQYAHEHGCPWDGRVCRVAAEYQHFDVLQYALSNDCPLDPMTLYYAAEYNRMDMIHYIHDHHIWSWDKWGDWGTCVCTVAVKNRNLPMLQYLHNYGCPWDTETCSEAAR